MKFSDGKLITVGYNYNKALFGKYDGLLKPKINIIHSIDKIGADDILYLTYKITINTEDDIFYSSYLGEYNFKMDRTSLNDKSNRKELTDHLQRGLILSLHKMTGMNVAFSNSILLQVDISPNIEQILISLDQRGI